MNATDVCMNISGPPSQLQKRPSTVRYSSSHPISLNPSGTAIGYVSISVNGVSCSCSLAFSLRQHPNLTKPIPAGCCTSSPVSLQTNRTLGTLAIDVCCFLLMFFWIRSF